MSKEITSQDVLVAVKELANQVSEMDKNLNDKIDSNKKDFKQEFNKVNKKIDVIDGQLTILSGSLTKTQAEVKVLQDAK